MDIRILISPTLIQVHVEVVDVGILGSDPLSIVIMEDILIEVDLRQPLFLSQSETKS